MNEPNLPRKDDAGERRPGFRAAGASLTRVLGPIVARHGGGILARLKSDWAAIIGTELAGSTWPESLGRGGVLKLRVASARALEIQHRAPLLVERINLFFGREAVIRLALIQGPLPLPEAEAVREPARPLPAEEAVALDRQLAEIDDPELRQALDRLGRAVIGTER
ncbi:MAG TPA: DciA family protein [Stellaceae bacterium]|nr:DciA family protein [Stellaceae bacterium]